MANKTRNPRTTNEQLEILINYLEQNKIMLDMKTHPLKLNEVKNLWEDLTNILNSTKKGAKKNLEEWKRFLITWKSKTKSKARAIKQDLTGTGGGSATSSMLNDIEERLIGLVGWNTVEGCDSVAQELLPGQTETNIQSSEPVSTIEVVLLDVDLEDANNADEHLQASPLTQPLREEEAEPESTEYNAKRMRPAISTPKQKKLPRRLSCKTTDKSSESLDNAAKVYMESAQKYLASSSLIAASIDKLAVAVTKYAEATFAMAEAKKMKYTNKCKEKDNTN